MINYYKILGIETFSNISLIESYKNSLKKYKNLPFYSAKVKDEIKKLDARGRHTKKDYNNNYN